MKFFCQEILNQQNLNNNGFFLILLSEDDCILTLKKGWKIVEIIGIPILADFIDTIRRINYKIL